MKQVTVFEMCQICTDERKGKSLVGKRKEDVGYGREGRMNGISF